MTSQKNRVLLKHGLYMNIFQIKPAGTGETVKPGSENLTYRAGVPVRRHCLYGNDPVGM